LKGEGILPFGSSGKGLDVAQARHDSIQHLKVAFALLLSLFVNFCFVVTLSQTHKHKD
jgi:hypothetical protein